ncbi:MAG: hypothetical protein NT076_03790 [Candidatus Pacearchaeota archaeon]|nr:hypothetical protein [Candidatus Pacearchaeota archaeon]
MNPKITNQDKILHELFLVGRELTVLELSRATKLKVSQVYMAIRRLKERELILVTKKAEKGVEGFIPIKIKVKSLGFTRKVLERKGLR